MTNQLLTDAKITRRHLKSALSAIELLIRRQERGDCGVPDFTITAEQQFINRVDADIGTVQQFITARAGVFALDLATVGDMLKTLKDPQNKHLLLAHESAFSNVSLGKMIRRLVGCSSANIKVNKSTKRVCILRNAEKYDSMSFRVLSEEYVAQHSQL